MHDAAHAELRRAGRPHGAETRGGEERDDRLWDVRQVRDDTISGLDAEPPEACPRPRHLLAQLAERELARLTRLRDGDDRHRVRILVAPEHVLGVVQPRAGKPLGPRQIVRSEHPLVRLVRLDREVVPDRCPEAREVVDGPAPQLAVVREVEAPFTPEPGQVVRELRVLARVRGRRPEDAPWVSGAPAISSGRREREPRDR
jgi:hypothetical protein